MEIKLNLIPPKRRKEIKKNNQIKMIIRLEIFLTGLFFFFFLILVSFSYVLNVELETLLSMKIQGEENKQYEKIANFDEQFRQVNSDISKIAMIKRDQIYWSGFFEKVNDLVFPGIDLDSISNIDYSIIISGKAFTREDLILFKEKIEKDECFSQINLPLSNLVGKSNIEFQIDFNIDKNCLKK